MASRALLLGFVWLSACAGDDDDPPGPPAPTHYRLLGQVRPLLPERELPAGVGYELTLREVWTGEGAPPFPEDAPVVEVLDVDADLQFASALREIPSPGVAGLYLDGDGLVRTVMDRRVYDGGDIVQDALVLEQVTVDGWIASDPRLAGLDAERAETGMTLVTYVDLEGVPLAGVEPIHGEAATPYFLSADHATVDTAATETTASGMVLFVGVEGALLSGSHEAYEMEGLAVGGTPGGCFTETIGATASK